MMQEVGNDEAGSNGESTFEFVERKVEDLHLGSSQERGGGDDAQVPSPYGGVSSQSISSPPTSTYVTSGGGQLFSAPVQSFSSPITSSATSSVVVPPPAALPAFLNPVISDSREQIPLNVHGMSSAGLIRPSRPIVSPYVVPSDSSRGRDTTGPQMAQTMYNPYQQLSRLSSPPPPVLSSTIPNVQSTLYNPGVQQLQQPHQFAGDSTTLDLPMISSGYSTGSTFFTQTAQSPGPGMWGWIKGTVSGNDFLHKVAEKAKSSVDSMITTLDPQMKQYILSGGDVDVVVASDKDVKVGPIRESFQSVFGRATVTGLAAHSSVAAQPVGFSAGLKGAEGRIAHLRQSGQIHSRQPVVALENFIAELTPERWYDIGCLVLDDPNIGAPLHVYTQTTPVPSDCINVLNDQTMAEYPLRWSGFALTVGNVLGGTVNSDWRLTLSGVSRRQMLLAASKTLATLYKQKSQSSELQGTTL